MVKRGVFWSGLASVVALGLGTGCIGSRPDDMPAGFLTERVAASADVARVVRVVDGDTYVLLANSATYRLRLLGVDAPEHDQAFGPQATDSVSKLLRPGRVVLVSKRGLDLYGRTLGAVLLPTSTVATMGRAVPLDSLLVVRGWAWAYDPEHVHAAREQQQRQAQEAGRGLWKCGAAQAVPPKLWRGFDAKNKQRYRGTCSW